MSSDARPPFSFFDRSTMRRRLTQAGELLWFAVRRFYDDNCFQTAASLTYTTLLAVVPLMTIGFAIFSAFPAFAELQSEIQGMILRNLVPEIGGALEQYLIDFMANAGRMPVLGVLGLAVTAVLLIWTIEGAFSAIWRVSRPRPLVTRILSFWAVVSLAPLFAGVSLSLSSSLWAALQGERLHGLTAPLLGGPSLLPLLVEGVGCSLIYLILPNRSVAARDAVMGGIVGAVLLEISKSGFAWYMRSFPAYQTIYGALAMVPIFLFWLYVAWSTLLFGAVVTASLPEWRAHRHARGGSVDLLPGDQLVLALAILCRLADGLRDGKGTRGPDLMAALPFSAVVAEGMLARLQAAKWLADTGNETWVLTRDLGEMTLLDLMNALGLGVQGPLRGNDWPENPWSGRLSAVLDTVDRQAADNLAIPLRALLHG